MSFEWRCSGDSNGHLVNNLRRNGIIKSDSVLYAFTKVDRALFAPNRPYEDSPQRIGHDATISAPHMHAHAAELLEKFFKPNSKVLDIGCGSGYLLAIFARMIEFKAKHPAEGPKDETSSWNKNNPAYTAETGTSLSSGQDAKVYGIEHIDELTQLSRENLSSDPYLKKKLDDKDIELRTGDGHKGWPEKGPFDVIHVGATANEIVPELKKQLSKGGCMFIPAALDEPYNQYVYTVIRNGKDDFKIEKHFGVRYVPLIKSETSHGDRS